jgi:hypothetical protein
MSLTIINTEMKALSHTDKLQLLQMLVQEIVKEERISLQIQKQGQRAADILQRMADRNALAHLGDPVEWQRELRKDRALPDRVKPLSLEEKLRLADKLCGSWSEDNSLKQIFTEIENQRNSGRSSHR